MRNILKLNEISKVANDVFTADYNLTKECANPDGIVLRSFNMHDYDIPETVLCVGRAGAGVNNIPIDKCSEKGIVVFNTPGANANAVKELVICGLFLAGRKITDGINWATTLKGKGAEVGKLVEKGKNAFVGSEIMGKTLGVIGLGAIGVKVANAAVALGMEVYGYDPYMSVDAAWNVDKGVKHVVSTEDIYRECDYITVHVPLMDATKHMVNADAIKLMKDGVVVLNFSRDTLVDEDAMVAALAEGKIKRYVVDFPSPKTAGKPGCIVIPHLGASTEESEDNCAIMAVKEIRDYMENGNIVNSVNYPNCSMGVCTAVARVGILHKNVKGMISKLTTVLGDAGINIADMTNKSRGDYAYSLFDLDHAVEADVKAALEAVEAVLKVRVIK